MGADLVEHTARFARALRASGLAVRIGDEADAVRALTIVDLGDRAEVHHALRTCFKVRRHDWDRFDAVFHRFWTAAAVETAVERIAHTGRHGAAGLARAGPGIGEDDGATSPANGDSPGYSPEVRLRRQPFDECTPAELADVERLIARLAPRLATARSRRLVRVRGRGIADYRRSWRRVVETGGELVVLARRARAVDEPRLALLCDTSGSMDPHSRFLFAFALALRRTVRRTEVFAFNTSLTRVTPWLAAGRIGATLERLGARVADWSGGTRIGECLAAFVERYLDSLVTSRTVVVVFSDGLDRGDTSLVAGAMRAIHAKARKVVWLNPLAGDARYEPTARAMAAAMPFVDRLAPAHNVESLERVLPELAA